jgi:hypothetical protein
MTTDYRATPEQWKYLQEEAIDQELEASCIFELRARVEALEAAQQPAAQKHQSTARRAIQTCLAQREEILAAFVAKYGFQPDEAIQVEQRQLDGCSYWWVERRSKVIQDDTAPTVKDSLTPAPPATAEGLVERVKLIIAKTVAAEKLAVVEPESWDGEARAVLREIAAATDQMAPDRNLTWERVALWLEREAER